MKLAVITDIHVDINRNYPVIEALIKSAREHQADVLIIGGDITNEPQSSIKVIEDLQTALGIPVYFVPGNHDLYDTEQAFDTSQAVYDYLSDHPQCLSGQDVQLTKDWILLGDLFWYDYSFADTSKYSPEDFRLQFHEGMMWSDKRFIFWEKSDAQVCDWFIQKMRNRLSQHPAAHKIVVSHMIMDQEFVNWGQYDNVDYFSAFLGSEKIGQLMEEFKVDHNFMGHVHLRRERSTDCCHYVCPNLGNFMEWETKDAFREVDQVMYVLEI